tara:strand:- start:88 stop:762 length:675 start_codon:yes stop_codon:yes gene_type:complete
VEITKSDILKLIEVKQMNTFVTHLLTILKWDFRPAGEVRNREIRVWRQNGWNGMFYPIFKFDLNKDGHLINISDRINPVGQIMYFLFCVVFSIPWLNWIFDDFDPLFHWIEILGWVIFLGIFLIIGFKVYRMEKKIQLQQIYEILDIEIENKEAEKEWGWKKIMVRSITYPLSIFLIFVCIFAAIPQGKYFLTLCILSIIGVYLYTDLKIILGKKTTGNNTYNK